MSAQQMRDWVAKMYPASTWRAKVAKMSDRQVMAIYYRRARP